MQTFYCSPVILIEFETDVELKNLGGMRKEVTNIIIECDVCGEHFVNGEGFACYTDDPRGDLIMDEARTAGWHEFGGKVYCPDCWKWDDDDNIVTKDGRRFDGETYDEILPSVEVKDIDEDIDAAIDAIHHCGGDVHENDILSKRLVDCNLSVRTLNGLHANGVDTVGDLVKLHKTDLLRMRNCGKKMLSELDDFLSDFGLCFN